MIPLQVGSEDLKDDAEEEEEELEEDLLSSSRLKNEAGLFEKMLLGA